MISAAALTASLLESSVVVKVISASSSTVIPALVPTLGAVVSTTKLVKVNAPLALPEASVTVAVQFEYVPSANALVLSACVRVMLWLPVDEIVEEELVPQLPPMASVPISVALNVTLGVESVPGVVTAVTSAKLGAIVSIVKLVKVTAELALPALSVMVTLQSAYAPSAKGELLSLCVSVMV